MLFCYHMRLKIAKSFPLLFCKACLEYGEKNLDGVCEMAIWSTVQKTENPDLTFSGKERGTSIEKLCASTGYKQKNFLM